MASSAMNEQEEMSSKELLKAQAHIWSHTFSFINSMFLKCALELRIPDAIHRHGRPMSIASLANALSIPAARRDPFQRLMNLLSHSGFFSRERGQGRGGEKEEEEDMFSLTTSSSLLVADKEGSFSPFTLFVLDETMMKPYPLLAEWFQREEPGTSFELAHGRCIWDETRCNHVFNRLLNGALAIDTPFISKILLRDHGQEIFRGLRSLVDVGGGTGTLARAIVDAHPHIKCTVLDLPQVIDVSKAHASPNVDFITGDMFQSIPPADAVLLKWVLHDWSDEECVAILKKCKEATPAKEKGGKVIVIEIVMRDDTSSDDELLHTQLMFDGYIMTQTTGKQRYEKQWNNIFMDAGFKEYKLLPVLGPRAIMEVFH